MGLFAFMRAIGIIRCFAILGLGLGIFTSGLGGLGAAHAQNSESVSLEYVTRALKSYEGRDNQAAAAVPGRGIPEWNVQELSARAILLRAQVNEHSGALARALQDYSNALWMDTLPPAERKKASDGKQRIMTAMGLNAPTRPGSGPGVAKTASAAGEAQSGGVLNMFSGLFGSSNKQPLRRLQSRRRAGIRKRQRLPGQLRCAQNPRRFNKPLPNPPGPPSSQPRRSPAVKMASLQPAAVASDASAGGFLIVFGPANDEASGQAKARQIKSALSDILVSRNLTSKQDPKAVSGSWRAPIRRKARHLRYAQQ